MQSDHSRTSVKDDDQANNGEICPIPAGSAFYRYYLAEMFGASMLGSGLRRARSPGILCYRDYVAAVRSDLLVATDDTVCLMIPSCTLQDDSRILLEGRKRHLAAVWNMRRALQDDAHDIDGIIASSIELLFVEVFKPFSLGMRNLYSGVVHLVRTNLEYLTTSQTPVTIFVLIQIRQVMLLESLASRTEIPIPIETWQRLRCVSTLLPESTEALMQLATQLPGLLDTAREVRLSANADSSDSHHALSSMLSLERELTQ